MSNETVCWVGMEAVECPELIKARKRIVELEEASRLGYVPQRNAVEMLQRLEQSGFGKPGTPNTLWAMVFAVCDEVDKLRHHADTESDTPTER